jgi:penicillin-binding protein 2
MLVFDQLKKDDPQLRFLAMTVLGGLLVLLTGLWWVQVVSTKHFQEKLESQSQRTVRIPAVRGRILDREGRPLAENHPSYNVVLYLDAMSQEYQSNYAAVSNQFRQYFTQQAAQKRKELGRDLTPQERRPYTLTSALRNQLSRQSRYEVTSNLVAGLGARLGVSLVLPQKDFEEHYTNARAMPLPLLPNLTPTQLAMFEEQSLHTPAMDLEIQSLRTYPLGPVGAHVLGYLTHDNSSTGNERQKKYNYSLEDYAGSYGLEKLYDAELRGTAGSKSVLVNNLGYRQGETLWQPAEPGQDVVTTLDLEIEKAAHEALAENKVSDDARGAVVVMDVRNGDVLAMESSPSFNPNYFIRHPAQEIVARETERWTNEELEVQMDHAMYGHFQPGSIFKTVVGMAALELGVLDPNQILSNPYGKAGFPVPGRNRPMGDTAPVDDYDFDKAMALSCNYYFVYACGLKPGVPLKIASLGQALHFGELTGLGERPGLRYRQEVAGDFPSLKLVKSWGAGDIANFSIGQGPIDVTPLQVAVMVSAIANGGKVYYPRLVSRIDANEAGEGAQSFPEGRIRNNLGVSDRTLQLVRKAMKADVEYPTGSGREAAVPGLTMAGKTGTAQVQKNGHIDRASQITWFASFAPYESPRYAVIVMVVSGVSGGKTCAPIAKSVYEALLAREKHLATRNGTLAEIHN